MAEYRNMSLFGAYQMDELKSLPHTAHIFPGADDIQANLDEHSDLFRPLKRNGARGQLVRVMLCY